MQKRQFGAICHGCISDEFLADEVAKLGDLGFCAYCGLERIVIPMNTLADRVHDVIHEHFRLTPGYPEESYEYFLYSEGKWERRGYPVDIIITDIAGVDERVAEDLTSLLSGRYAYPAAKEGMENPYGYEAMYEEQDPFDGEFRVAWAKFRREIRSRSRFLDTGAEELLAEIFGDLTALKSSANSPVIREINPENQDHFIWRARIAQSDQELEKLLKSPAKELGPPPSKLAKAGRMNAQGISVFYGALEQSTCLSELRPPVGSRVVIGQFELLRTITLLDLGALAEVYVNTSYFDPKHSKHKNRAAFLKRLVHEIARPVVPEAESIEYLTTQVVAEYLAYKASPQFDGIIYPSSQTQGSGNNVVLFNKARGVEPYERPTGSSVEISLPGQGTSDLEVEELDGSIWVIETVPSDPAEEASFTSENTKPIRHMRLLAEYILEEPEEDIAPTLRLDVESVVVQEIKGVTYSSSSCLVRRIRRTPEEQKAFEESLADIANLDGPLGFIVG